jgi:protein-S-isoprenylcysteine O-methyltransferase Ste14
VSDPRKGPGIRVPPPFAFVAGWLAAWALNRWIDFRIDRDGAGPWQTGLGVVLLAAGLGVAAWGMLTFIHARTPVIPVRAARTVVRTGPYRFSRNPMYAGLAAAYTGLALLLNLAWPIVLLPIVIVIVNVAIIAREERHLLALFGDEYESYRRRVRRWI